MHPPDSLATRIRKWLQDWGILALLVLLFFILDIGSIVPRWIRIGILISYVFIQNIKKYPITAVGRKRQVDTKPVTDAEQVRCDICGTHISKAEGEHRRYTEQQVAFGIPLRTTEWGKNVYCTACETPISNIDQPPRQRNSPDTTLENSSYSGSEPNNSSNNSFNQE